MHTVIRFAIAIVALLLVSLGAYGDEDLRSGRIYVGAGYHRADERTEDNLMPGRNVVNSVAVSLHGISELSEIISVGAHARFLIPQGGYTQFEGERFRFDRNDYDRMLGMDLSIHVSRYWRLQGYDTFDFGVGPHMGMFALSQSDEVETWYGTETVGAAYSTFTFGIAVEVGINLSISEHFALRTGAGSYYDLYEIATLSSSFGSENRTGPTSVVGLAASLSLGIRYGAPN